MSKSAEEQREIIEVVAEPMEEESSSNGGSDTVRRLRRSLSPILAGLIIDVVDFTLLSPALGLVGGAIAGYILATNLRFPLRHRLLATLVCGLYCTVPPTRFFPLATMIGFLANFREQK